PSPRTLPETRSIAASSQASFGLLSGQGPSVPLEYAGCQGPGTVALTGMNALFLFGERELADLADVDVRLDNFFAVLALALKVVFAGAAAVVDVDHHRLARHDHVLAQNVFFPIVGRGARCVEAENGGLGFVDDLDMAIGRRGGIGAGQGGEGNSRQQEKTLEH